MPECVSRLVQSSLGTATASSQPVRKPVAGEAAPLPYRAIIDHILENLARRITVDELAVIARLNVLQLSRAFRREHATTPYRLVLEVRVQHATRMLREGTSICETALHAGFADQSHFTRHFKRLTGMTPKRYAAWQALEHNPAQPWPASPAMKRPPATGVAGRIASASQAST